VENKSKLFVLEKLVIQSCKSVMISWERVKLKISVYPIFAYASFKRNVCYLKLGKSDEEIYLLYF
jgi:hypothetical protein